MICILGSSLRFLETTLITTLITDAEYLAYAYEQAGYDDVSGDYNDADRRSGDGFQSSFGYVPQSLRGRSMLRGYMTPYGAAGFGPNPYDPWGSSFYQGYGAYNPGFIDPYNTWGSAGMGGGWGTSGWGINPYVGGAWGMNGLGMNPYAYQPYGGGLYGSNPYGWGYGNVYGGNPGFGSWGYGDGFEGGTPVVVAQRTPIWASSAINSNAAGGRLLTNKAGTEDNGDEATKASRQPSPSGAQWTAQEDPRATTEVRRAIQVETHGVNLLTRAEQPLVRHPPVQPTRVLHPIRTVRVATVGRDLLRQAHLGGLVHPHDPALRAQRAEPQGVQAVV